jgi:TctA family transporter
MGGLMIWGLNPGPMLFIERPDFVWGLIASMYIGNIVAVVLVLATVPLFAAILRIPFAIIGPLIIVICFIGAWTVASSKPDLWIALVFGVVGYVFKKLDYPIAPLVLALVLGDKAEDAFRQSMLMSQGSLDIFYSNPLVSTITTLAIILLTWPLWAMLLRRANVLRVGQIKTVD